MNAGTHAGYAMVQEYVPTHPQEKDYAHPVKDALAQAKPART